LASREREPRCALLLGGSRGIGRAISTLLDSGDWSTLAPPRARLDLSMSGSVDNFCQTLTEPVDAVIFSAGENHIKTLKDVDPFDLELSFNIHVLNPFRIVKHILTNGLLNRGASIIFLSSLYSEYGRAGRLVYSTTKHATNGLVKNLAIELGYLDVKVNSVIPGFVDTELTRRNLSHSQITELQNRIPLSRIADVEEIAQFVIGLCETNTYVTGQTLVIDGGLIAGGFWSE